LNFALVAYGFAGFATQLSRSLLFVVITLIGQTRGLQVGTGQLQKRIGKLIG